MRRGNVQIYKLTEQQNHLIFFWGILSLEILCASKQIGNRKSICGTILYDVRSADKVHFLIFKSGITSNKQLDGFIGKEISSSECYPRRTHTIDFDQEMSSFIVFMEISYVTREQNSSEELLSIMKTLTQIHCDKIVNYK